MHFEVVLGLEDRLDDLLAPLDRAIGRRARTGGLVAGRNRQQVGVVLACRSQRRPGRGMRIGDHQQFELLDALLRLRHAGDGVAAVAEHHHRLDVVLLRHVLLVVAGWRRTSGSTGCPACSSCGPACRPRPGSRQSACRTSHSRLPRPATNAATRLRPGRSRAAASRYRGRDRSHPARWCGRGRCWRPGPVRRHCRWPAAACSWRARWRCRRCAGSAPSPRSGRTACPWRTFRRRA